MPTCLKHEEVGWDLAFGLSSELCLLPTSGKAFPLGAGYESNK